MPNAPEPGQTPQKRVLIVKFGSIGDVIMTLPGAALLHQSGCGIDWVASTTVAPVLRLYPWIHVVEVDEAALLRGSVRQRLGVAARLWRSLRARTARSGGYGCIATLYYDRRYGMLTKGISAERRVRLSTSDRRFQLLPGRHHVDEYARILAGAPDTQQPAQLAPVGPPQLPMCDTARPSGRTRIVIVPGGARNVLRDDALRRWPVSHYVDLTRRLLAQDFEVILVGGPDDRWVLDSFAGLIGTEGGGDLIDLIGRLTLVETLAVFQSATVTVVHDTGPLHLAGLTDTGIVAPFGPTDPHGRLPRRSNVIALWGGEGFACRPCYDGRSYAQCPQNSCLAQIRPERVAEEVFRLVAARGAGQDLPPEVRTPPPTPFVQLDPGAA